jgi:hypothetical protein
MPVELMESADAIADRFEKLHKKVSLPIIQADGVDPQELAPNYAACDDFGGCPYRKKCFAPLPLSELLKHVPDEDDSTDD